MNKQLLIGKGLRLELCDTIRRVRMWLTRPVSSLDGRVGGVDVSMLTVGSRLIALKYNTNYSRK